LLFSFQLAGVFRFKFSPFELDRDQALQMPVEEQQVDEEFFSSDIHAILVADETEAFAHDEDEIFDVSA